MWKLQKTSAENISRNNTLQIGIDIDKPVGQRKSAETTSCNLTSMLSVFWLKDLVANSRPLINYRAHDG
jgi:hypothetical protein